MQLAVIEYARNVCKLKHANSTEFDANTPYPVIDIIPEQKEMVTKKMYGATMRLGEYPAILRKGSRVQKIYGKSQVFERHRHRYEVNPAYIEILEEYGLVFSGRSPDGKLMEFLELPTHKFFIATQAHPEFKSRPLKPHPLFVAFLKACSQSKAS
jgi:CTP synthase